MIITAIAIVLAALALCGCLYVGYIFGRADFFGDHETGRYN
jgi:hypothetical protein